MGATKYINFIVYFFSGCVMLLAQSRVDLLSKYDLWSHYPLINSVKDAQRVNEDMALTNVHFAGLEGIYSDGRDSSGTGVRLASLHLPQLNVNNFVISVEFKLDKPASNDLAFHRTILNAGQSFRWMHVTYKVDSLNVILGLNNTQSTTILDRVKAEEWYTLTMFYDHQEPAGGIYINDSLFFRVRFTISALNDNVLSTNCRCGIPPLQGYWRNLKIYRPKSSTGIMAEESVRAAWRIFPQPLPAEEKALNFSNLNFPVFGVRVLDITGKSWYGQDYPAGKILTEITLPELVPGVYVVQLHAAQGRLVQKVIKQ